MSRLSLLTALTAGALLAAPGAALAAHGGGTPPIAGPCVSAVGKGGGIVHGNKLPKPAFTLSSCSTADETLIPHYVDHASDAWGLGRDCGPDQAWNGDAVALKAGKSLEISTFAVRASCPAAETHVITVTFTTLAGQPAVGTGYFGWSDPIKP